LDRGAGRAGVSGVSWLRGTSSDTGAARGSNESSEAEAIPSGAMATSKAKARAKGLIVSYRVQYKSLRKVWKSGTHGPYMYGWSTSPLLDFHAFLIGNFV
jgi:hypothetical protein